MQNVFNTRWFLGGFFLLLTACTAPDKQIIYTPEPAPVVEPEPAPIILSEQELRRARLLAMGRGLRGH